MKKRFIIVIPYHFEFYKCFIANLQDAGYEISLLFITDKPFKYKTVFQKIYNFIQKSVFKNKTYKIFLRINQNSTDLITALSKINTPVDYSLVIKADYLNAAAISCLKNKSKKIFGYQWDGYKRSLPIQGLIHLFDTLFVFDTDDCSVYKQPALNIKCITNFYLDNVDTGGHTDETVFFIGSYLKERAEPLRRIAEFLSERGVRPNINVVTGSQTVKKRINSDKIKVLKKPLSYSEMLAMLKTASYILDFENAEQNGLTFRVFEALFFQKKLITNNASVYKYDFYHPNNIFVWNETNIESLENFLKTPYKKIDATIVEKYAVTNWIRNIIDEQPYQEIIVPE